MELTKITMNLTETDIQNAQAVLEQTNARNKAHAVGKALAIAAKVTKDNAEILLKQKNGEIHQLIIT